MPTRSRPRIVLTGCVVVAAGLLGRRLPGIVGDGVGGVLYAVLLYLGLSFILPRAGAIRLAMGAAGIGLAIELLQLTAIPAAVCDAVPAARFLLGSTFAPLDLVFAVVGAALAPLTDLITRAGQSPDVCFARPMIRGSGEKTTEESLPS